MTGASQTERIEAIPEGAWSVRWEAEVVRNASSLVQCDRPVGLVAAVHGVVLDVDFPTGQLPAIGHALAIRRDALPALTVEVHAQLSAVTVRCISLATPTGIRRGLTVTDTGQPVMVPVGEATLGRVLNVLGEPVDGKPPLTDAERRPINGRPPPLTEQRPVSTPVPHRD
jgi:F-type H+/Na+-transporting ATPase subunit beta